MSVKMLIDTDPGVDDAMAIYFAACHPEIDLVGLTSVHGNVSVDKATRNALALAARAGIDIPVAQGAGHPLELEPFAPSALVHGLEGFGSLPAENVSGSAINESATEFLCRMAEKYKGELVVCAIGPITNVALAIRSDPGFARNVSRIVFMGGALDAPGNITPFAEANTYHDPHALKVVLESGAKITMIGLDVTMQVLLTEDDFADIARRNVRLGSHLQSMSGFYIDFYRDKGVDGCAMHDALAVMACVEPGHLGFEKHAIDVMLDGPEIGRTFRNSDGAIIDVALSVNDTSARESFMSAFNDKMT